MYSPPSYRGIDAAPLTMPFYLLFFGMMLSDSGYGLLLFIGGTLLTRLKRPSGDFGKLVKVISMSGLSTAICGLFIGTFLVWIGSSFWGRLPRCRFCLIQWIRSCP